MKDKHTHGPWKVNEHSEVTFKDGRICDVDYYNVGRGEKGRYQLPHEANARLIAAAPELLEFVEGVAEGLNTGGNPGYLEDAVEFLEERAQRIIAKIEGDESNT